MLNKISLKNFKAFREAEIELKPITILVGPNNSGKSSLIQSIILLQQTLMGSTNNVINTEGQKFGSFADLVHQKSDKKEIDFKLDFSDETSIEFTVAEEDTNLFIKNFSLKSEVFCYTLKDLNIRDYTAENEIRSAKKGSITFAENFKKNKKLLQFDAAPIFYRESFFFKISSIGDFSKFINEYVARLNIISDMIESFTTRNESNISLVKKTFNEIMDGSLNIDEIMDDGVIVSDCISDTIYFYNNCVKSSDDFYKKIKKEFSNIKYIGPIRDLGGRSYEIGKYNDVGSMGEHAVQILANDSKLKTSVEKCLSNMRVVDTLDISKSTNKKNFEFLLKTKITEKGVNFVDMGCGTSQILPIIVQSLLSDDESLIIVEQPELHLHPKVQADLADFFVNVSSENNKFVLETHSDYFIERIRYNIMVGDLNVENVAIYYIEQNEAEKCSTIETININSKGQYSNLPEGYITNFRLKETQKMTKKLLESL